MRSFTLTRSGAEAARQAHNLEVGGSNPPSATRFFMKKDKRRVKISLKPAPAIVETLIIVIGIIMVWRGVWHLLDTYLYPENELLSSLICIFVGLLLIYLPDKNLKQLM